MLFAHKENLCVSASLRESFLFQKSVLSVASVVDIAHCSEASILQRVSDLTNTFSCTRRRHLLRITAPTPNAFFFANRYLVGMLLTQTPCAP